VETRLLIFGIAGTYLAIGSLIALFAWSKRDRDEWLADDLLVNSLTFLRVMISWPKIFIVFGRVWRNRNSR